MLGFTKEAWVFLLLANLLMLFVGCFLEPTAAITILVPLLLPIATQLGVDPVHFGLVMVLNLMIGLLHPPMGMVLFVLARVAKLSVERTTVAILPWLVPLLLSLVLLTYVPAIGAVAAAHAGLVTRAAHDAHRRGRPAACRPAAAGAAQRRDPVLRDAGNAVRAHRLRRRQRGHRLQLHHRHRRLVGDGAAARPPGAAADRHATRRRSKRSGAS